MSTAIFDVTHSCLEFFDLAVAKHDSAILTHLISSSEDVDPRKSPPCDFLGIRNSFLFWIDYTGALSLVDSSLDARLDGLADISAVVMELLEMVLRSLRRLDTVPEKTTPYVSSGTDSEVQIASPYLRRWEDSCQAIQSGLDQLHFVALAIRKASAKRLDQMVTTSVTPEDVVFRKNVNTLVRYRFPAARKALCQQLGDSIADRRQMILQSKRHAKKLAVRREPKPSAPSEAVQPKLAESGPALDPKVVARIASRPSEVTSSMTKASRPDHKKLELRQLQAPRPKALSTVISNISTSQEHSLEYPDLPQAKDGEVKVQCPFCLAPLDRSGSERKRQDAWRRHVDEHTKPYPCLFPQCSKAMVFFTRRREWKAHMETSHSKDWLRKVHTMVWFCDIDHEEPLTFDTEALWREHMRDLDSHPERKLKSPTQAQLDALAPRKQQAAPRDAFVCPLCEQIPQKVQPLVSESQNDQTELHNQVIDHVADHLKSLSLMVLPSLQDTNAAPELSPESVELMRDHSRRDANDGSTVFPPSGIGLMDGASLPPDDWADKTFGELEDDAISDESSALDPDFSKLTRITHPPQVTELPWVGTWLPGPSNNLNYTWSDDPVLSSFMLASQDQFGHTQLHYAAKSGDIQAIMQLVDRGAEVEAKNADGFTALFFAAQEGRLDAVQYLLSHGANLETQCLNQRTPLSVAAANGHGVIVQLLAESGAEKEAMDLEGHTALVRAAMNGHSNVVRYLLEAGVHVDWGRPPGRETREDGWLNMSALCAASYRGNVETAKVLLHHGADTGIVNSEGESALSLAVMRGSADMVIELLTRGADARQRDVRGRGLIFLAVTCQVDNEILFKILHLLLEAGANINQQENSTKMTAVLVAIECQRWKVANWLINNGADLGVIDVKGHGVIAKAVSKANPDMDTLRHLLAAGAQVHPVDPAGLPVDLPLAVAAANNECHDALRLLLDHGAEINKTNSRREGCTPLMEAASARADLNVSLLLERGADVNLSSWAGNTALSASLYGAQMLDLKEQACAQKIAMRLINAGADANKPRRFRNPALVATEREELKSSLGSLIEAHSGPRLTTTACEKCGKLAGCEINVPNACCLHPEPLCSAAAAGSATLVESLLDNGAAVNAWSRPKDGEMVTALIIAAEFSADIVRILLAAGADPNAQDPHGPGPTALKQALCKSILEAEITFELVKAGADLNIRHEEGRTALFMAVERHLKYSTSVLIEHGADVNLATDTGQTPLMVAVTCSAIDLILPLLKAGADPRIANKDGQTARDLAAREKMGEWEQVLEVWSLAAHILDPAQHAQVRLWLSVEFGYGQVIDQALEDGADIAAADETQETALHLAVHKTPREHSRRVVKKLLDSGAPLTAINRLGLTPVNLAVSAVKSHGHTDALREMLEAQVDMREHLAPLQIAVILEDTEAAKTLIGCGADPSATTQIADFGALWLAVNSENAAMMNMLLQAGADPNTEKSPFLSLYTATFNSSFDMVKSLLEAGASSDKSMLEGVSPLEVLSRRGDVKGVDILLSHGTLPSVKDLITAVRRGHVEVVKSLLFAGASVHDVDEEGWFPLHHAAMKDYPFVIRALVEGGADMHAKGPQIRGTSDSSEVELTENRGKTPLHVSAFEGHQDATSMLLKLGANCNCQGADGKTALHYAAKGGHVEVARMLIEAGCDLNQADSSEVPLSYAVSWNHPEMVRFLLAEGAEIVRNGINLLSWAAADDHVDMVAFMRLTVEAYATDSLARREAVEWLQSRGLERCLRIIRDGDFGDDGLNVIDDPGLRARLMATGKLDSQLPVHIEQKRSVNSGGSVSFQETAEVALPSYALQLVTAIKSNDVKRLGALLEQGFDVNNRTSDGLTALDAAIFYDRANVIKPLAAAGADLNGPSGMYLRGAVESNNIQIVRALLEAGANVESLGTKPSPLHLAISGNKIEMIELLLVAGADTNRCQEALHLAARNNDLESVNLVIEAGIDVNMLLEGNSALDVAAKWDHPEMVRLLLGAGATTFLQPFLLWSIRQSHYDIMRFLQLIGEISEDDMLVCIEYARSLGEQTMVRMLFNLRDDWKLGGDLNWIDDERLRKRLESIGAHTWQLPRGTGYAISEIETYHGYVRTPGDAIKLFEACRLGLLPRVQRRLSEKERQSIRSGSVFVWDEREAGMRRWTDGKSWSASRVSGSFLTYREMEGKRGGGFGNRRRNSGKTPGSGRASDEDQDDSEPEGYRYKADGLMKQAFSITTSTGQHLHLISYYSRPQPGQPEMNQPSSDPALRTIVPVKGMYPESSMGEANQTPALIRPPIPQWYMMPQSVPSPASRFPEAGFGQLAPPPTTPIATHHPYATTGRGESPNELPQGRKTSEQQG